MQSSSCPCTSMLSRFTMSLGFSRSVVNEASSVVCPPLVSPRSAMTVFLCDSTREIACLQKRGLIHWRITRNGGSLRSPLGPVVAMAAASTAQKQGSKNEQDEKVVQVHTIKEFDEALTAAKSKLVVVEYAASHSANSRKIYPSMVELSSTCQDVVFILVMGDESGETKELCKRVGIEKVPHFVFYKNKEIIHEEEGIGPDELLGDVLYYGDPDAPILQLHSKRDMEELIQKHSEDGKLLVMDVGLKHCGPCVKVYPTFVKLAKKMKDTAVFARMNGDENDELMTLLKQMDVVEVPTFLFIRDGKLRGRYVGSGKGELIGEILRYQGVRVTF